MNEEPSAEVIKGASANITYTLCPRCGEEDMYVDCLSRRDNKTMICTQCGTMEAMFDLSIQRYTRLGQKTEKEIEDMKRVERAWLD